MTDIDPLAKTIHVESADFKSPYSEAFLQRVGGSINALLSRFYPIGSILHTMLSEAQFQSYTSAGWILADGRSVAGSRYADLASSNFAPDLRGVYLRGRNYTRPTTGGSTPGDTQGDVAVGTLRADLLKIHAHDYASVGGTGGGVTYLSPTGGDVETAGTDIQRFDQIATGTSTTGSDESAPRSVVLNTMIRIN